MYRYIGNKTKVLKVLTPILTRGVDKGSTIADLMCGTASVASALKDQGMRVIAADQLTFAIQHAEVRLLMRKPPRFSNLNLNYLEVLNHLNNVKPTRGYFFREYSDEGNPKNGCKPRQYFTGNNAKILDAISDEVSTWRESGLISERENSLLRHNLVLATNRVANIAGTYGHYRSTFSRASLAKLQLSPTLFEPGSKLNHKVYQGNAEEISKKISCDILYLDPPYKKRQYAANYHLIETIARADKAEPFGESGLRDWWPQYSDFCSKRKIEGAFDSILTSIKADRVFVSYSEDGLISVVEMRRILSKHGNTKMHSFVHTRFKSNQNENSLTLKEFVFETDFS